MEKSVVCPDDDDDDDDDGDDMQEWLIVEQTVSEFDEMINEHLGGPVSSSINNMQLSPASSIKTEL